jgi:hypothetical protein
LPEIITAEGMMGTPVMIGSSAILKVEGTMDSLGILRADAAIKWPAMAELPPGQKLCDLTEVWILKELTEA